MKNDEHVIANDILYIIYKIRMFGDYLYNNALESIVHSIKAPIIISFIVSYIII